MKVEMEQTLQVHLEDDEKLIKINIITFNSYWNILIATQTYFITFMMTYILAYRHRPPSLIMIMFVCDVFYLIDFIGALIYVKNWKTLRFLPYKPKNWKFFLIDFISLMPLGYGYETYVARENKSSLIFSILLQNRCLRIYRIFMLFNFYNLTLRKPYQYVILMSVKFIALSLLCAHVISCIWFNLPQSNPCTSDYFTCLFWREVIIFRVILHQWPGEADTLRLPHEILIVLITMICGLVLIYGDLVPHLLLIVLRVSRANGRFYQKYVKLERFLKNIGVDSVLSERIKKYFSHFWLSSLTPQEMENLMKDMPLALKKEVFTDIYWDAFRHSDIFRDVSRSCKRSLALVMKTEYLQEGDFLWKKGSYKDKMIYLVEGVMELMAAENENSPIMSFSSGTVLGEMSIFWLLESKAIIKCRTLCQIQTIVLRKVYPILLDYPKDRNIVFQKLNKRLVIAKITQWRKRRIAFEKMMDLDFADTSGGMVVEDKEDRVKWVKMQWRAVWEIHERHLLIIQAQEAGLKIPALRKQYEIQPRLDTVSNYMDLMVLSDVFEEKKDVVCLKTTFPWAIEPNAEFLRVWKVVVVISAIITSLIYPVFWGWLRIVTTPIFTLSIICSIIFLIDLILIMMTAVKTKHGIITDFTSILLHNAKRPTFYLDILAAMPFHVIEHIKSEHSWSGYLLLPGISKAHIFFKPETSIRDKMVFTSVVKNIFFFVLLIYWFASVLQLTAVHCFPNCSVFHWDMELLQAANEYTKQNLASVFLALSTALGLSSQFNMKDIKYLITMTFFGIFFFLWICWLLCDFYMVYSIKISSQLRFRILYDRIMEYLENVRITPVVQKRIVRIVRFQWLYNKADDLLTATTSIESAPKSLRREVYFHSIYQTLRRCPIFQHESSEFVYDTIEKCEIIAVPSGTLLVHYGFRCHRIHLLHKGFCQTNSFLKKDVAGGLAAPILVKPGEIFPTLAVFASAPPPITVLTLTDCVIVVFKLEEVLKSMIAHEIFRDLVLVLRGSNLLERLSRHMFAMVPMNIQYNAAIDKKEEYEAPFRRYGWLGIVLKHILLRKQIVFDDNLQYKPKFKVIHVLYCIHLLIMVFVGPLSFGLLVFYTRYLMPLLLASNCFVFVFIYLKFHFPYFDAKGLLITHPLYTMWHYLTTNFLLDMIMTLPLYELFYLCYNKYMHNEILVALMVIQKLLCLIPMSEFFNVKFERMKKQSIRISLNGNFYGLIILVAFMNAATNYDMYWTNIYQFDDQGYVIGFVALSSGGMGECRSQDPNNAFEMFVSIFFWQFAQMTSNNSICDSYLWQEKIYALLCSLVGTILWWMFFGWFSSHSAISDTYSTVYQERMKSFIEFMISSKTMDKIVEKSIGYFEHQWSRSRGQNLREICKRLPHQLHEELAYPLYRPTLDKALLFANADESFFGMLSVHLDLVHFNRGSVILSRGQVQSDLFFVHRGNCFVFDWFMTLGPGSLIGDINHSGRTVNNIFALTHVELLRIDSTKFFQLINNYYDVEVRFIIKSVPYKNFINSNYISQMERLRPVDSRDVLNAFDMQTKSHSFEDDSYFEDTENILTPKTVVLKQSKGMKRNFTFTIYPGTTIMMIYDAVNLTCAFFSMIITPVFMFFGGLTLPGMLITAILDVVWAILMFASFRVGIEDKVKGDVITHGVYIAKAYLLSWDGFFLRLISCIPFEYIPALTAKKLENIDIKLYAGLRSLRLIRVYYLVKYLHAEINRLKVSSATRYVATIVFYILYIHLMVLAFLIITTNQTIVSKMSLVEFGADQVNAILILYHFVVTLATGTNMYFITPQTIKEELYFNVFAIASIFAKGLVIKYILTIKYIHTLARGKHKGQIALLETYLKKLDLSPSILKEVLDHKQNLLIVARSENNPTFLLAAPSALRRAIMSDLYLSRLRNSPIFNSVHTSFLKLLVCRLKRQIFFPGQKIVEKGDVDKTMYFIHKGEVYVVDQTDDEAYVEFVVGRLFPGDEFGQVQGLAIAKPHTNTYIARTIVEILLLQSKDWIDLKKAFPQVYMNIVETLQSLYVTVYL